MRMSAEEFLAWEHKAVTLLGMSGVGKTMLANKLPMRNWFHYSADYRIGTKYLEEPILDNIKRQAMQVDFLRDLLRSDSIYICSNITVHNLEPISTFLGKVGNPAMGGLSVDEFKERQRLHREAEIKAMQDVPAFVTKAKDIYGYAHFVNDSSGSVCALDDDKVAEILAEHTVIIYLRADHDMEDELIRRAVANPKPLYYQEAFLDEHLAEYLQLKGLRDVDDIEPDGFVQWVFPRLLAHRRPMYEAIADRYGYQVQANSIDKVRTEDDVMALIANALRNNELGDAG